MSRSSPNVASRLTGRLVLPAHVSAFEARHLARNNRLGLILLALHVPALTLVAWRNGTRPGLALVLSLLMLTGPVLAYARLSRRRLVSVVEGMAAMGFGGLLVHFGQGPTQIEMHFYFFSALAIMAVFGNPMVVVASAGTMVVHHVALWFLFPASVFNYEASAWVLLIHATFIVVQTIAACYIARTFFDNVIGLETIVRDRTAELDRRNRDLRLVLDNVRDACVTVDAAGVLSAERSRTFDSWFGASCTTLFEAIGSRSDVMAAQLQVGWEALFEATLPLELLLDQLPGSFAAGASTYSLAYVPIGASEPPDRVLVVVTDTTAATLRDRAENERREFVRLFEALLENRGIVESYFSEGCRLVEVIAAGSAKDLPTLKRALHTLKGNSAALGLESLEWICHELETHVAEEGEPPPATELGRLLDRWGLIAETLEGVLGGREGMIEISREEHVALKAEVVRVAPQLWHLIHRLRLEPTRRRLMYFAEQARRIAGRLEKELDVVVVDDDIRVDPARWAPFWSAMVHVIRNAVDHGIELPEERRRAGKSARGRLTMSTRIDSTGFVVEVADDGRGIDWETLRDRASREGGDRETIIQSLFRDGVSTVREVTELSGRGVGMGSILAATTALGGEITVESDRGAGTTVRMWFPRSAAIDASPIPTPTPTPTPTRPPTRTPTRDPCPTTAAVARPSTTSAAPMRPRMNNERTAR